MSNLADSCGIWHPQTANGAVACQLMDAVCIGNFPMQKVSGRQKRPQEGFCGEELGRGVVWKWETGVGIGRGLFGLATE